MNTLTIRKKLGWSQVDLADHSGVSVRTIRRLENGSNISSSSYLRISNALNQINLKASDFKSSISQKILKEDISYIQLFNQNIPYVNVRPNFNELAKLLAEQNPFAILYYDRKDDRMNFIYSENNNFDAGQIARKLGGKGTKNQGEFITKKPKVPSAFSSLENL